MSWLDPRNIFGMPEIKAEGGAVGSSVGDSWTYSAQQANNLSGVSTTALGQQGTIRAIRGAYSDRYVDPYREQFERIEYILKRTVPDYDELVNQFNALKDIERSNNE